MGIPQSLAAQLIAWIPESVWQQHGMHPPLEMGKEREYFDRYGRHLVSRDVGTGSVTGGGMLH